MGMIVANARVVLEGAKRVNAAEKEAKGGGCGEEGTDVKITKDEGGLAQLAWVKSGKPKVIALGGIGDC